MVETDLQKETIASLLVDSSANSLGVGHQQIISNNLDLGAGSQLGIAFPVILVKGILDGYDRIVTDKALRL